jgi:hypothetical protein
LNCISRQVIQIKGVGGYIFDITISGYIIRGLLNLYAIYKLLVNITRADLKKVKLELLKAKALLKEDSLKKKPSFTNFTLKALAA